MTKKPKPMPAKKSTASTRNETRIPNKDAQILIQDMERVFGIPPRFWADTMFLACGILICNPTTFEEALKRMHGYRCEGETFESINDFVERKWGKEAMTLLLRAAKGTQLTVRKLADENQTQTALQGTPGPGHPNPPDAPQQTQIQEETNLLVTTCD
jgi:hypothetical protein